MQREDSQHPKTPMFSGTLSITTSCGFWGSYKSKRPPCCENVLEPRWSVETQGKARALWAGPGQTERPVGPAGWLFSPVAGPAFPSPLLTDEEGEGTESVPAGAGQHPGAGSWDWVLGGGEEGAGGVRASAS